MMSTEDIYSANPTTCYGTINIPDGDSSSSNDNSIHFATTCATSATTGGKTSSKRIKMKRTRMLELAFVCALIAAMLIIAIVSVLLSVKQINERDDDKRELRQLLAVQIAFRHGQRTPLFFLPGDVYQNHSWPEGLGGLTAHGKKRAFRCGEALHARYRAYIANMLVRNVNAQSSPVSRCLETTESLMAGMFPPQPDQIWSQETALGSMWQPIAVETVEPKRARQLGDQAPCPEADKIARESEDLPEIRRFLDNQAEFLRRVTNRLGIDVTGKRWQLASAIQDTLSCESDYFDDQFVWPKWMSEVGPDCWARLTEIRNFGFTQAGFYPAPYLRLKAGPLIERMLQNLHEAAEAAESGGGEMTRQNRKIHLFGTHDTILSWLLNAIGFFSEQPRFASGLIIELRKSDQNNNTTTTKTTSTTTDVQAAIPNVHLYYANSTESGYDIYPLRLNESKTFEKYCDKIQCRLDRFTEALQPLIPVHIERECGLA